MLMLLTKETTMRFRERLARTNPVVET